MITVKNMTVGQGKYIALVKHFFPDVYKRGEVTHKELKTIDAKLHQMRATDKKYKVAWPIWLITKNAVSRGLYSLPVDTEDVEDDPDMKNPFYAKYKEELGIYGLL